MPEITLALQEPLLCDGSLVESGNEVDIYLNDEIFDAQTITDYSPVRATVDIVAYTGTSKCPKGVSITVTTTTDLPPSVLTLDPCDISKISCVGCCVENAEAIDALDTRVTDLENNSSVFDYGLTHTQTLSGAVNIDETHFQGILSFDSNGTITLPAVSSDNYGVRIGIDTNAFSAAEVLSINGLVDFGGAIVSPLYKNSGLHVIESTANGWVLLQSPQSTINGMQARKFAMGPGGSQTFLYSPGQMYLPLGGLVKFSLTGYDDGNPFFIEFVVNVVTNGTIVTSITDASNTIMAFTGGSVVGGVAAGSLEIDILAGAGLLEGNIGITHVAPLTLLP